MTMPTRPAPAPPRLKKYNAAVNANVTLQQLHLLQQQQQQQQLEQKSQHNIVTVPKLTIKLPPPPSKGQTSIKYNENHNAQNIDAENYDRINDNGPKVRVSQQTRYTPTTNWNDTPFENILKTKMCSTNGGKVLKKVPPPRPPPPRCNSGGVCKKISTPVGNIQQSTNVLNNLFHRKKSASRCVTSISTASRIYNSATYGSTNNDCKQIKLKQNSTTNWISPWNASNTTVSQTKEPQLISFDSPPSSPTFTQKSNSDCLSVDSFSSDSNFSSPNYGGASQPESGFEDDFNNPSRSRPATTSPRDPWESVEALTLPGTTSSAEARYGSIGTTHVRNLNVINARIQNSNDNPLCNGKSLLPPAPPLNTPTIIKPKVSQKPKAPKPPVVEQQTTTAYPIVNDPLSSNGWSMPHCASTVTESLSPPMGSKQEFSILNVITGKIDALQLENNDITDSNATQPYGISMYAFETNEDGDLCFRENEKIYLLEQINADWLKGRTRSGCEGIFPASYIDVKVPLSTNLQFNTEERNIKLSSKPTTNTQAKCLYNFSAEVDGDLEIKENDLVTILYRINADWLYGELDGRRGQFPEIFLESVPSNIPTL